MIHEEYDRRNSPQERKRQMIVNMGSGCLLAAFVLTSVVTGLSCNPTGQQPRRGQAQQTPVDELALELARWKSEADKNPKDPAVWANWAFFLMTPNRLKQDGPSPADLAEADSKLAKALELDPKYGFALRLRGQLHLLSRKPKEARKCFEDALKVAQASIDSKDPNLEAKKNNALNDQVQAHMGLVKVARMEKNLKDAYAEIDQIFKVAPGSLEAQLERAELKLEEGQIEQARKDLQKVSETYQKMAAQGYSDPNIQNRVLGLMMMMAEKDKSATPQPSGTPPILDLDSPLPPAPPTSVPNAPPSSSPSALPSTTP